MVYFPTLNLSFKVHPVAFELFGIDIYYYAICIVVGIVLALILCYQSKEKFGIDFDFVLESLMAAVFIGIIGARIYYIAFNSTFSLFICTNLSSFVSLFNNCLTN